jgi:hypothetical protein
LNAAGEILFCVKPDEEGLVLISPEPKIPARGYARHVFASDELLLESPAIGDMCTYSAALALNFSARLYTGHRNSETPGRTGESAFISGTRHVEHATEFLVGSEDYNKRLTLSYCQMLNHLEFEDMQPPPALLFLKEQQWLPKRHWERLLNNAARLAFIMLAFAAVGDLNTCESLVLATFDSAPPYPHQAKKAGAPIVVDYDHWYRVLGYLLTGRSRWLEMDGTALLSGWGWSLYHDCVADCDPVSVVPGRIWIQRGVPYHEGRIAHRIIDGAKNVSSDAVWATKVDGPGAKIHSRCAVGVTDARFIIAHRDDTFVVSRRYKMEDVKGFISVGYLAMAAARWDIPVVKKCKLNCPNQTSFAQTLEDDQVQLSLGMASMKGFCFWKSGGPRGETMGASLAPQERVAVSFTAGNKHAQWLSLIAAADARLAHEMDDPYAPELRTPVLRSRGVCLSCFIQEASLRSGDVTLIL